MDYDAMGQAANGMHLVETVEDVATLRPASGKLSYVTQTTLSVDDAAAVIAALKARFPRIVGPKKDDICYATQNRQDAVKFMAPKVDIVHVLDQVDAFGQLAHRALDLGVALVADHAPASR